MKREVKRNAFFCLTKKNVFTVTFDQFNFSSLKTSVNLFKNNLKSFI